MPLPGLSFCRHHLFLPSLPTLCLFRSLPSSILLSQPWPVSLNSCISIPPLVNLYFTHKFILFITPQTLFVCRCALYALRSHAKLELSPLSCMFLSHDLQRHSVQVLLLKALFHLLPVRFETVSKMPRLTAFSDYWSPRSDTVRRLYEVLREEKLVYVRVLLL